MTAIENYLSAENIEQIVLVFTVAYYLVQCFCGYRLMKAFVAVIGFILGFAVVFVLVGKFYTQDAYIPTAAGILAGVSVALIAFRLYLMGVFIFCGALAAGAVTYIPFIQDESQELIKFMLSIAAFVVVGILAVKLSEFFIILVSAIFGSIKAVNTLSTVVVAWDENLLLRIAVITLVAVLGVAMQKLLTRKN
jgi:hypothetical protein